MHTRSADVQPAKKSESSSNKEEDKVDEGIEKVKADEDAKELGEGEAAEQDGDQATEAEIGGHLVDDALRVAGELMHVVQHARGKLGEGGLRRIGHASRSRCGLVTAEALIGGV